MKGTCYDTKDNNSNDNMNDDFLNYPNFRKFIDSNNNYVDHENFEESRKYIHREITKTLNANSVKVCRNMDERILAGNTSSNKFCLESMEKKNGRKDFSCSGRNDLEMNGSRSLRKFAHCSSSSSGRRSNEESSLSAQTGQSNICHPNSCRGMNNNLGHGSNLGSINSHRGGSGEGNFGAGPPPSSQFLHGARSNELSDNNNNHHRAINYLKRGEMNNEDVDRINEGVLLKEKNNLLKHEFFLSEPRYNNPPEEGDNRTTLNLDNSMCENDHKLDYARNSNINNNPYDLVRSNGIMEDVKFSAFSSNEFGCMRREPPGLVPIKGEDIKKKKIKKKERDKEKLKLKEEEKVNEGEKGRELEKGDVSEKKKKGEQEKAKKDENQKIKKNEHENIAHFIKQQILENAKMERGASGDHFRGSELFPNLHAKAVGAPRDSSSASRSMGNLVRTMHTGISSGMHYGNRLQRYEVKNHMSEFQGRMSEKKGVNNFVGLESDSNKVKKYNHLKDNFHLNSNQTHFYPNMDHRKNNSEVFLSTDVNDKVYANNIMYDDYFTIENMETCEEKKEFFKNEGYSNKMKKENSLAFRMHPNFNTKELLANRKKYFHSAGNRDLSTSTNYMKSDYYNESNISDFCLDGGVPSQYVLSNKDYVGNNLNGEVSGMNGHMEKMEYGSSFLGEGRGDRYSQPCTRLPNGVIVEPSMMYDNCNDHLARQKNGSTIMHANFGSIPVHGNMRITTVHTDNSGQEEEDGTMSSTLVNAFTLKREENYYQNGREIMRANEMTRTNSANMADMNSVLFNWNNSNVNPSSNVSIGNLPGRGVEDSNSSMFRTYDIVSAEDGIRNGAHGEGNMNGSNLEQGENKGIDVEVEKKGIKDGIKNGIENGIENGIGNMVENENEEPVIKLFFGNLAPITTEKDMHNLFSNFGKCDSLIILKDRRSKSRGSGFVTFYNMQEAVNAIKSLNNKIILSGAHKPLEVRFPENKEEKKLRTKLLNAAKWKGKKIAPSGCLPISTEDILNQSSLQVNNGPGGISGGNHCLPLLNQLETPSNFLTENNEEALYDIKETVSFGYTGEGMLECAKMNMLQRGNANHYACSEDFSELRKAASETTNDTVITDYVNRVEEGSNIYSSSRHNSYKEEQDNLPDEMNNMSLSIERKEYSKFLPNFLLDNNSHGNGASNSFQSLDEAFGTIRKFSLDADMEEVNMRSNGFSGGLEVNGGLSRKVVHEIVHEKMPGLRSESSTMGEDTACRHDSIDSVKSFRKGDVHNASAARASNFCAKGFVENSFPSSNFPPSTFNSSGRILDDGDEANSYFSSFCQGFPLQSKIVEEQDDTLFSYLNKEKSLLKHNMGEEEVYQGKIDYCRKRGDFPGINELEEINHFRQLTELEGVSEAYERGRSDNGMRNVLLRGSEEMVEVGKEENLFGDIYEGNKGMGSPPMDDDGYSNMNVHYLGFDLSRLIQINEDILLPQGEDMKKKNNNNNTSSTCFNNTNFKVGGTSHGAMEISHLNGEEIMASNFYHHGKGNSSSNGNSRSGTSASRNDAEDMCKAKVGQAHGTMDLLNVDLFGNKNFDVNDNLSDEMLGNLISLYAQNKSSMITSHMFSYLNNVLGEINSALDIFNKFSVKTSMKNIAEEKEDNPPE
ncbi:RNA-binding protein, putative [Plasmodium knowlesi strain H]|uniref:RNA-binding protein, putative n=3 Tax=Plasmodium knowlesi TaxID=5850 RepID=A0A5K1UHF8_PLAKH|nr:RNA-binding protein, putative [Plasmodium knowlesi strain H]OTN64810.1 putative RNA binding protein [Plasmodium knowlesi]CAA9988414.1 RNA-binding protein, putative [Plasmodium knowlesi strain H]SBO19899.1 RNA-binding protein, putative [Plasmodium knowlesi strain H]SBO20391.1 RNA-binding protein, putative [Plasmodium knowlesi strain H]VVS77888.1 RNA-binding protein, putative [Plasmodium knowlesi strain H]|eukprot:XP_002259395.1 RNA binding protein, putative [Plasmodium knowlesi strain H]